MGVDALFYEEQGLMGTVVSPELSKGMSECYYGNACMPKVVASGRLPCGGYYWGQGSKVTIFICV